MKQITSKSTVKHHLSRSIFLGSIRRSLGTLFFAMTAILLLLSALVGAGGAAGIHRNVNTLITSSAVVSEIEGTRVFTDSQEMVFIIPDLPVPPTLTPLSCPEEKVYCQAAKDVEGINVQTSIIIQTLHKAFTLKGIGATQINKTNKTQNVEDMDDHQLKKFIQSAGMDWFLSLKSALDGRVVQSSGESKMKRDVSYSESPANNRTRRFAPVTAFAPLFSGGALKSLFVSKGAILGGLTKMRSFLPFAIKSFLNLPKEESEFSAVRKVAVSVTNDFNTKFFKDNQILVNDSNHRVYRDCNDFKTNMEKDLCRLTRPWYEMGVRYDISLQLFQQSSNLISSQMLLLGHVLSLEECRDGKIPILFVPPASIEKRLLQLQQEMDPAQELVIPAEEYMTMYNLQMADCKLDDDGGVVGVKVFLKPKGSQYKVYEFQPIAFQYKDMTCDLDMPSGIFVRDMSSGAIYPVSSIDEETCSPRTTGLCQLPTAANADVPHQYCLTTLLEGGSVAEIKDACQIVCKKGSRVSRVQITKESLVVAHLPKTGAEVKCDGQTYPVVHDLDLGALRFTLGCGCVLSLHGKIIGSSKKKICDKNNGKWSMDYLLPVQLSTLDSWVPQVDEGVEGIRFAEAGDLTDLSWRPTQERHINYNNLDTDSSVFHFTPFLTTFIQWVVLLYVFYRYRMGPFSVLSTLPVNRVHANTVKECRPTDDMYIIHYAIIIMISVIMIPMWAKLLVLSCKAVYRRLVKIEAEKMIVMQNL